MATEPRQGTPGRAGVVSDVTDATENVVTTVIRGTEAVAEEVVHAVGRLSNAAVDEIFGLACNVATSLSDTAGSLFGQRRTDTSERKPH